MRTPEQKKNHFIHELLSTDPSIFSDKFCLQMVKLNVMREVSDNEGNVYYIWNDVKLKSASESKIFTIVGMINNPINLRSSQYPST